MRHRGNAIEARDALQSLHAANRGGEDARRQIGHFYDRVRHALKMAEIDALLSISQGLRDLVSRLEYGERP